MGYVIAIIIGYLLGCSSMALYISKWKRVDIQAKGSGNLGASNATVLMGWGAGVLVALHDIGKGLLAVVLAKLLFPELDNVGVVAGVASVLGHIFPFYLKFKGGKGLATFWGMTLALNWKLALILFVGGILITLITDYIALATTGVAISVPVYLAFAEGNFIAVGIILIATAVMIFKHKDNYIRILKGTEIGLRSTARGDLREK